MNKAVFLDRDGVINKYTEPVNTPKDLDLFPWTAQAINNLNRENYQVHIVTNQGGIECGYFSEQDLHKIHDYLIQTLQNNEAYINDIAYCPHFKSQCNCRKPKAGMIFKLAQQYKIDLKHSYLVGDRKSDIIAGNKSGCTTIKIGSKCSLANYNVQNLADATNLIIKLDKIH